MDPLATNPFGILTFIVAPAILTNASSVMALGTSNRFARAIDRARALSSQVERTSSFLGKMGSLDGFVGPCFRGRSRGRTDVPGSGPRRKSWWRNARKAGRSLRRGGWGGLRVCPSIRSEMLQVLADK